MIEFAIGFGVGAFTVVSLCAIFRTDGRDWGEPVCGEPMPKVPGQISIEDLDTGDDIPPWLRRDFDPMADLEAWRNARQGDK